MKRLLSLLLIFVMLLSLAACGKSGKNENASDASGAVIDGGQVDLDNPLYLQMSDMIEPIFDFVEYNHILGNSINYEDISAEDFWNIVAIVVSAYPKSEDYCEIDVAGAYHLDWDTAMEYAKTFLYESWHKNNTPSFKASYSASADPGSGVIDLIPLSVDNFDGIVKSIEKADSDDISCDYILNVDLSSRGSNPAVHHYQVYVADWEDYLYENYGQIDDSEHIMPYIVTGFSFIGTDEP